MKVTGVHYCVFSQYILYILLSSVIPVSLLPPVVSFPGSSFSSCASVVTITLSVNQRDLQSTMGIKDAKNKTLKEEVYNSFLPKTKLRSSVLAN